MLQNPSLFQITGKTYVHMLYIINIIYFGCTSIIVFMLISHLLICEEGEVMCSPLKRREAARFLLMVAWQWKPGFVALGVFSPPSCFSFHQKILQLYKRMHFPLGQGSRHRMIYRFTWSTVQTLWEGGISILNLQSIYSLSLPITKKNLKTLYRYTS